jgi:hypothetical protein
MIFYDDACFVEFADELKVDVELNAVITCSHQLVRLLTGGNSTVPYEATLESVDSSIDKSSISTDDKEANQFGESILDASNMNENDASINHVDLGDVAELLPEEQVAPTSSS